MQLASGSHIPDGLLAANALLSEKLHQGFAARKSTLHQGFRVSISSTPLGIIRPLYDEGTGSRYTGKERDTESGLDYFGARYYSSVIGRFSSPDWAAKPEAVPYSSLGDPQSLNLYTYVGNNPLSKADADGHCWPFCLAPAGGGVVGALTTAAEAVGVGVSTGFAAGVAALGIGAAALSSPADQAYFANGGSFNTAGAPMSIMQQSGTNQSSAPTAATPTSPEVHPNEVSGKTPSEIDATAKGKGLIPKVLTQREARDLTSTQLRVNSGCSCIRKMAMHT